MRTLKMLYMLSKMLDEANENINTRSVNMSVWNCQKKGAMIEYNFLLIQDGPLSNEILADVSFLEMLGIINIHDFNLEFNGTENTERLIKESKDSFPIDVETIDNVVKEMKEKDILNNEDKILNYWKDELIELGISIK